MLKIGLTGGIGSGKSTVAGIFEILGIPVYYADLAARELMNTDPALKAAIGNAFGPEAYKDQQLDRAYMASLVFNDPARLEELNRLVHPVTIRHAAQWMAAQKTPYVIKEAALLFESGASADLDQVIGVSAPRSLRIKRVMERDGISEAEVLQRMNRQMEEEEKMKRCDHVINNNEKELLNPQVLAIHRRLIGG